MPKAKLIVSVTITLFMFPSVSQAQFWQTKDPSEWSTRECASLMQRRSDSAWVRNHDIGARGYPIVPSEEPLPGESLEYVATISSAWTIQRSYLCALKLTAGYKTLSAKEKTALEQQYLKQEFPDTVVFQVNYWGSRVWFRHSSDFWKAKTQEELTRLVTLVIDGKRIQPSRVTIKPQQSPWGGLEVVFPRQIDGRPLLAPDMKEVILEVADPNEKVELRFEPRKMVVRGELVY
jgi:hypothetical protein